MLFDLALWYREVCTNSDHMERRQRYLDRLAALKEKGQLYEQPGPALFAGNPKACHASYASSGCDRRGVEYDPGPGY